MKGVVTVQSRRKVMWEQEFSVFECRLCREEVWAVLGLEKFRHRRYDGTQVLLCDPCGGLYDEKMRRHVQAELRYDPTRNPVENLLT